MPKKISLKWSLLVLGAVSIFFFAIIVLPSQDNSQQTFSTGKQINLELPARLKIPGLDINTSIEAVGLTADGAMEVPKGPVDVAWFDQGPQPGEKGSAVIAGHSGWKNGLPAVFDNLSTLQKGDKIYVENNQGRLSTFVVRESRKYDPKADAQSVFLSNDGKAHLNLITCIGAWNAAEKSRSERLVVFADLLD